MPDPREMNTLWLHFPDKKIEAPGKDGYRVTHLREKQTCPDSICSMTPSFQDIVAFGKPQGKGTSAAV